MKLKFVSYLASLSLALGTMPAPLHLEQARASGQADVAPPAQAAPEAYSAEQLDAMLAPIALYPDTLLTQTLMATTNPLQIVAASRWLREGNNKDLKGEALENALKTQDWDPAVISIVPFPQVLDMLNTHLDWTEQLGYAMQNQQPDVFASIQRLRAQAQASGNLASSSQQVVHVQPPPPEAQGQPDAPRQIITIEPAQPDVVYVPAYNPQVVYGSWPYPATPPVYYAPAPAYGYGAALATGLAFGAGIAITAGLWGWARPNWGCCWGGGYHGYGGYGHYGGYGNVNVNVNRYNSINVNKQWNGNANGAWRANNPNFRPGGSYSRPNGPVGRPVTPAALPGGGNRPALSQGNQAGSRPGLGQGNRPGTPATPPTGGSRPGIGQGTRPASRPGTSATSPSNGSRPGIGQGTRPASRPGTPSTPPSGGSRPGAGQGTRPSSRPGTPSTLPSGGSRPGRPTNPAVRPGQGNPSGAARPPVRQKPSGQPSGGSRPAQGAKPNASQRPAHAKAPNSRAGAGARPAARPASGGGPRRNGGGS